METPERPSSVISYVASEPRLRKHSEVSGIPMPSLRNYNRWYGRSVLDVESFDRDMLYDLFNLASSLQLCVHNGKPLNGVPLDSILKVVFYFFRMEYSINRAMMNFK